MQLAHIDVIKVYMLSSSMTAIKEFNEPMLIE